MHGLLTELGITGYAKTTGNRGVHVYVRLQPRWDSYQVRAAAVALAREAERRKPDLMTAAWWKEERGSRVFIDFNQNAPHKTVFGAWSVRARPGAQVSTPLAWEEIDDIHPDQFTIATLPARLESAGDPWQPMNDDPQDLAPLLDLAARDEAAGLPDAPVAAGLPQAARRTVPRRAQPRQEALIAPFIMNAPFATALAGWKASVKNRLGWTLVPNAADVDSAESMRIAAGVLDALGVSRDVTSAVPKDPGGPLEQAVCDHLRGVLPGYRTGRDWLIGRSKLITGFDQYAHLKEVDALVRASPQLRISLGMDYLIKPDVTVGLAGVRTGSGLPPLHAAISCKWTIRSDRVQNIRHECLQMIRHRRGRQPHLVTVTAEPLPSRLASIARGTGEVDAVYHIAYDAMDASVAEHANAEQRDAWREVTRQRRVLSYEALAETLASQ